MKFRSSHVILGFPGRLVGDCALIEVFVQKGGSHSLEMGACWRGALIGDGS